MSTHLAGVARVPPFGDPSRRAGHPTKPASTPPVAREAGSGPASPASPSSIRPPAVPIELTLEVLRGPFRPLIVWGLFWGARPFSELMRHVPDVTKALRRELVEMERIGLVCRDVRPDSNRRA